MSLDSVKAEVTRLKTVKTSVLALIKWFADEVIRLKADPVALQALADSMKADNTELADAVVANTPSVPPIP